MSQRTIMIIEDEEHIQELLTYNLEKEGYNVVNLLEGNDAKDRVQEENPDLILLDLMLPGKDGIEICREIRQEQTIHHIPIIMLTAKGEEFDRVLGLEIGADDYITKPFSIKELIARIRAIFRRVHQENNPKDAMIKIHDLAIDTERYEVMKNKNKVNLTLKEFELLHLLSIHRGKVLTRDFLLDKVWGYNYSGETRTVDVHIRHLRKKLEEDNKDFQYIETVRGVGYRIN